MTSISPDRILVRETAAVERRRPIIIESHPRQLVLRLKGTRRRYSLWYDAALWCAVKAEAEQARAAKAQKKRAR